MARRSSVSIFGQNVFATHLPNALSLLGSPGSHGCGHRGDGAAAPVFYAALGVLTSIGPFLFTRFAIPESLLSFLLLFALCSFLTGLESRARGLLRNVGCARPRHADQRLIAPVFFAAAAIPCFCSVVYGVAGAT